MHYTTIIISDVHLGSSNSRARELIWFLKRASCDKLILNGDIIDGWRLKKSGRWKKIHTRFFRVILKMIQEYNTRVVYVRGNHDDILDRIIPLKFGNISLCNEHIHMSRGKRFYVTHGDIFDLITTRFRWIANLGDIGYTFLLWLNKRYNNRRIKTGKPYYSLSRVIKQKVKTAVSYISNFESELVAIARQKKCDGIICGHIHHPAITLYDNILYLNSGDWVESLSALVEDQEGNWKILYYDDLVKEPDASEISIAGMATDQLSAQQDSLKELEEVL